MNDKSYTSIPPMALTSDANKKEGKPSVFDKIVTIMQEYIDIPKESIKPESRFLGDLHLNSFDIMDMIGKVEDEFNVEIDNDALNNITTVQDLVNYLNDLVS